MTGYLRRDGTWVFYMIQSWYERDPKNDWDRSMSKTRKDAFIFAHHDGGSHDK